MAVRVKVKVEGVSDVIKTLKSKRQKLKNDNVLQKIAHYGAEEAKRGFDLANADTSDISYFIEKTKNGYKLKATGKQVTFIEFGAGVFYNGVEPYPLPRPPFIVNIGEYGKGNGKKEAWGYYDENGELHITNGVRAEMPMYHAAMEMNRVKGKIYAEELESV